MKNNSNEKVISMSPSNEQYLPPDNKHDLPNQYHTTYNGNKNGGGGNMNKDYVTHEELNHAVDRLSDKMDLIDSHIDTKFEKVNTKFEEVNTKFEEVNTKFETVNAKLAMQETSMHKWIITVVSVAVAVIGILIKFL